MKPDYQRDEELKAAQAYFETYSSETWHCLRRALASADEVLEKTRLVLGYTHTDLAESTWTARTGYPNLLRRLKTGQPVALNRIVRYFDAMGCDLLLVPIPRSKDALGVPHFAGIQPPQNPTATRRRERRHRKMD